MVRIGKRREIDEDDAIREFASQLIGNVEREGGLAAATRSGDGHQSHVTALE
jgi:hypothetical protein